MHHKPTVYQYREKEIDIPIPVIAAFIAGVFALFGVLIAHILSFRRERHARFAIAVSAFRMAFAPEVPALGSPATSADVRDLLVGAFPRHSEAVTVFRHNLPWLRKRQFDRAWKQYHSGHCFDPEVFSIPPEERLFMDYFSIPSQPEAAAFALKRIHALLRFAK